MPVGQYVDKWTVLNGAADPRLVLDGIYWSLKVPGWSLYADLSAVEEWCNNVLGPDNWFRRLNKIWFTSEQDYSIFNLVWAAGK